MRKKRIRITHHLINNAKYALLNAIEIHNKPNLSYRYEICTLLVINARELIMKAYIYKFINKRKAIFKNGKNGIYVSFGECLDLITPHIWWTLFNPIRESLFNLYEYRNKVAHSYGMEYDSILFSLLSKNIIFFKNFCEEFFGNIFWEDDNYLLLPIWFKEIISPIDFLWNQSNYENAPKEVQDFIKNIIISIKSLNDIGINEPILWNFQISFLHTNNPNNADFVARLDDEASISLNKQTNVKVTNDKSAAPMRFNSYEEEKEFQNQYYPLLNRELRAAIWAKYPYKLKSNMVEKIKFYKNDSQLAFACRGELQFKYSVELIDIIWNSFPDNPRLEHLKSK